MLPTIFRWCINLLVTHLLLLLLVLAWGNSRPFPPVAYAVNISGRLSAREIRLRDLETGYTLPIFSHPAMQEFGFSPDGQQIIYSHPFVGLHQVGLAGREPTIIAEGVTGNPLWSPNGEWIVFMGRSGDEAIYLLPADGSAEARVIAPLRPSLNWSPDGERILYSQYVRELDQYELQLQHVVTGETESVLRDDEFFLDAALSPDGNWLAYTQGAGQLLLRNLTSSEEIPVQLDGMHHAPQWSPDSRYILFMHTTSGSDRIIEIAVANREGSVLHTVVTPGLTLDSNALWWR